MFVHRLKLRAPQLVPAWTRRAVAVAAAPACIVAGPGYGKTVYAAQLYHAASGTKSWCTVDIGDADSATFARYLAAALSGMSGTQNDEDLAHESPEELTRRLAGLAAAAGPSPLFVFDDVHVLSGSRGERLLAEFAARGREAGCRFVFAGRALGDELRHAAGPSSVTVATDALAFDEATSRRYLRSAFPSADDAALAQLAALAEGWPAGLAMLASMPVPPQANAATDFLSERDGETRRLLFEYFDTEVFGALEERERDFLLRTSLLDELVPDACDTVVQRGGSEETLASLAGRGLFVTRRGAAYAVHGLFREFLRDTLLRTHAPEVVAELHCRVAHALRRSGDVAGAIAAFFAAGDLEAAGAELETSAFALLQNGRLEAVDAFLQRAGSERVARTPALLMARGRLEQLRGEFDAALGTLERAIAGAREGRRYELMVDGVRFASTILASRGEFERLLAVLERALEPGAALPEAGRCALCATLGAVYLDTGRVDEALELFRSVMPSLVARGDVALQGVVLHNTGVAHVRRGEPYAALADYERALACKRAAGQRLSALVTLGNQLVVLRLLGDIDEAERLLREFAAQAGDVGDAAMLTNVAENEAALAFARGSVHEAERAYREAERRCDSGDVLVLPEVLHGLARAVQTLGNAAEADDFCARALALLRSAGRPQQAAPILVTRAECALERGVPARALELAREARAAGQGGPDAVVEAATGLSVALLYVRLAALRRSENHELDAAARESAAAAIALIYQRNYRFILKTEAKTFAALRAHLQRWGIATDLLPAGGAPADLRLELLGEFRVYVGGKLVRPDAWKRRRARDVFAYLVANRTRTVSRARLVDVFWPDADADAAHDSLRVTVTAIRKALGDVVKFEANGYRFVPPPGTFVDSDAFDATIEAAHEALARGATDAARDAYLAAADLYRGDFLRGLDEGAWQWRERERLRAACLEALRAVAYDASATGGARERALDRLLDVAPFDIDAVRRKLDATAARSRASDALREYDAWRARYRATIGSDPPNVWTPPEALAARV